MPDFDIDAELPSEGVVGQWSLPMSYIQLAKLQSRLYERLYSASANAMGDQARHIAALELDAELQRWATHHMKHFEKSQIVDFEGRYLELEVKFNFYNSLVMVHRVDHGGGLESERKCLKSAREAISTIRSTVLQHSDLAESGLVLW